MKEKGNEYRVLVVKLEGKRSVGTRRHRWEDNIKTDLSEIGWVGMDWNDLPLDRDQYRSFVNTVMHIRVP
jgi:hypothetical protein